MDAREDVVAGRFRLEAAIDSTERYAVWRAVDLRSGARVAFKRLRAPHASDPALLRRFADEARFTKMLCSPHVVAWVADGADAQGPWLALEWIDGVDAAQLLARRNTALSVSAGLAVGLDLLAALAAAHGPGVEVIHRGVVPSHVLIGNDGLTRLTGIGLARHAAHARLGARDAASDRAVYAPPEAVHGDVHGPRGDLYAVGAVLWELLSGRRLDAYLPTRTSLSHARPPLRRVHSDVPASIADVVDQALSLDPLERPPSASVMAFALRRAAARAGVEPSRDDLSVTVWGAQRLSSEGESRIGRAQIVRRRYIQTTPTTGVVIPRRIVAA